MKNPRYKIGDRVQRRSTGVIDTISEVILMPATNLQNVVTGEMSEQPARWCYRVQNGFGRSPRIMFAENILNPTEEEL